MLKAGLRKQVLTEVIISLVNEKLMALLHEAENERSRQWRFVLDGKRYVDSYLSEHVCEGALEGYLLTGRHGMFVSYEAFLLVLLTQWLGNLLNGLK